MRQIWYLFIFILAISAPSCAKKPSINTGGVSKINYVCPKSIKYQEYNERKQISRNAMVVVVQYSTSHSIEDVYNWYRINAENEWDESKFSDIGQISFFYKKETIEGPSTNFVVIHSALSDEKHTVFIVRATFFNSNDYQDWCPDFQI